MAERPVKVRCHGEVKRLRMTRNLDNVLNAIRRGFSIPVGADVTLTMVLGGNGTRRLVTNDQTLQYNWNELQELQVTLPLQAQRAMVKPAHVQTVVDGRMYRIDEPPSRYSPVVQQHRSTLGVMEHITEFRGMFPKTSSLVSDLYRSVVVLRTSVLVNSYILVSKLKSVVKSLIDIFVKTETSLSGLIKLCENIAEVLQQLSLDLVNGDHQAAVASLVMLMRNGEEMEKVARELDGSIERSMREIDDAIQTINSEKGRIERKFESTTREKEITEENVKQQSEEIDRLERKLTEYRNKVDKKETNAAISGATTGVGIGLSFLGILFPPILLVTIPTAVGSSIYLGVTVDQIKDLEKEISAAKDKKGREERRKQELEQTLSRLKGDLRKLEPVADCLHDVWGQMNKIKSTVVKMNSFWPGLNNFCESMMASERRLILMMKRDDSRNPANLSEAFKRQIVNFSARSVALQEVCQSCQDDVEAALSTLRLYQDVF